MARRLGISAATCALAATLAFVVASPLATAALYKWVDANGRVVYSDQPPTGVKSELVGSAAPSANPDALKELANKEAEFKKRQADKQEDAQKTAKARGDAQKLATFCSQARTQAAGMRRTEMTMYRLNEKGERVAMDEAARKAEADRLEAMIKERNCP